jgi:hypothetical protein
MARETLFRLGPDASELLRADRTYIWVSKEAHIDIDLVDHETRLRSALPMSPGPPRDAALSEALSQEAALVRARTLKEFEGQRGRAQSRAPGQVPRTRATPALSSSTRRMRGGQVFCGAMFVSIVAKSALNDNPELLRRY